MKKLAISCRLSAILGAALLFTSVAQATNYKQTEPIELLIDFKITGQFVGLTAQGLPKYVINGPGFAPAWVFGTGEIMDRTFKFRKVTDLIGGEITFSGTSSDPVIDFTCLPGSCSMPFANGSRLQSDAGVPLQGRAINFWGPVQTPDFDPDNGIIPIRILGCGGLEEVDGEGPYAGMVGSICFNGVLNFNQKDPLTLTGSSKCTITLHSRVPLPPE